MIKISASILTWDFAAVGETLEKMEKAGVDRVHLDVMDGHFVPNISFGPAMVSSIRSRTGLQLETHLMIENPGKFIEVFRNAGSDTIIVHLEAAAELSRLLKRIRDSGARAGVSINPGTGLQKLIKYLGKTDMILMMSVNPGFGGQKFMEKTLPRLRYIKREIIKAGLNVEIGVDGGINESTAIKAARAGAGMLVMGNQLYRSRNASKTIYNIRKNIDNS